MYVSNAGLKNAKKKITNKYLVKRQSVKKNKKLLLSYDGP